MDSHFRSSHVIKHLFKERSQPTRTPKLKRKRSREQYDDMHDNFFSEIMKQLDYYDLLPTLRSLLLENFYILLATNPQSEYYDQLCCLVVEFRNIIHEADSLFEHGRLEELYDLLTQTLYTLLLNSSQLIMLFHLSV